MRIYFEQVKWAVLAKQSQGFLSDIGIYNALAYLVSSAEIILAIYLIYKAGNIAYKWISNKNHIDQVEQITKDQILQTNHQSMPSWKF